MHTIPPSKLNLPDEGWQIQSHGISLLNDNVLLVSDRGNGSIKSVNVSNYACALVFRESHPNWCVSNARELIDPSGKLLVLTEKMSAGSEPTETRVCLLRQNQGTYKAGVAQACDYKMELSKVFPQS